MSNYNDIFLFAGIIVVFFWLFWSVRDFFREMKPEQQEGEDGLEKEKIIRRSRRSDIKSWGLLIFGLLALLLGMCSKK